MEVRIRGRAAAVLEAAPRDPDLAAAALEQLIETVVDVVVGPQEMRRVARFIIREQMQPTAAFEVLYGTMSNLHRVACTLFAAAAGLESYVFIPADLEEQKVLATGVYGTNLVAVRGSYDDVNRLCTELSSERDCGRCR